MLPRRSPIFRPQYATYTADTAYLSLIIDELNSVSHHRSCSVVIDLNLQKTTIQPKMENDASRTAFRHEPLDIRTSTIRLLRLQPRSSASEEIAIEIFHERTQVTQDDGTQAPVYRALSYEWGPPELRSSITVSNSVFEVRQNLYDFLAMYSQHIKRTTVLWIDQLCIDQGNVAERNQQVGMMGAIYKHAAEVIIWLGLAATDSPSLFGYLAAAACYIWQAKPPRSLMPELLSHQ